MDVSWILKKAQCQRIDAFKLWCWRRLLRVPWTARRSNQSILKETSPGCSLGELMLKLKLQYFGYLMWRADSFKRPWFWERLKAGGEGDERGWDGCMASPTQWTWVWVNSRSWWWTGRPGMLQSMELQMVRRDWAIELNWYVGRTGCWSWSSNSLAIWYEELTLWKRPWCWERLRAGGEGDDRGWDGWMASLTQWTWVWVNSGSW